MNARIFLKMKVGKRTYLSRIDCIVGHTEMTVVDNKISIYCNQPFINEKISHKDYKKAFEISQDGDYHLLVEFKKNPKSIDVYSFYNQPKHYWEITIVGCQ
jgi:exoribonuclease II